MPDGLATPAAAAERNTAASRFGWYVVFLIFLATLINYLDRQAFAIATPLLARLFHLTNNDIGNIAVAFMVAYLIGQGISGRLLDAMGTRWGFGVIMAVWSLADMATAGVRTVLGFGACRFALALGEAGNWPGGAKAVSEWFPQKQRAFALSCWNMGSSVGAIVAPFIIGHIILAWGWQAAFVTTGLLGVVWLAVWLPTYRTPAGAATAAATRAARPRGEWLRLFSLRQVWGLFLVRVFTDPVLTFYVFWLPKYFADERGFSMRDIADRMWLAYVSSIICSIISGGASSLLIHHGWSPNRARKTVMAFFAATMLASLWVPRVETPMVALLLASVAFGGFYGFSINTLTIPTDLMPSRLVASVSGISGMGGALGSLVFNKAVGLIADAYGFGPVLVIVGLMPVVAAFMLLVVMGTIEEVKVQK